LFSYLLNQRKLFTAKSQIYYTRTDWTLFTFLRSSSLHI